VRQALFARDQRRDDRHVAVAAQAEIARILRKRRRIYFPRPERPLLAGFCPLRLSPMGFAARPQARRHYRAGALPAKR
jgi:hypothetical protein